MIMLVAGMVLSLLLTLFCVLLAAGNGGSLLWLAGAVLWALAFVGAWRMWRGRRVSYDFALVTDELRIDRVTGSAKRKSLLTAAASRWTSFAPYSETAMLEAVREGAKAVPLLAEDENEEGYLLITQGEKGDVWAVAFAPPEDMATAMTRLLKGRRQPNRAGNRTPADNSPPAGKR